MALAWTDYIGVVAGALIVAAGGFVLLARPHSTLHRLFFVLALMDGVSTLLFRLVPLVRSPETVAFVVGSYWYYYIAFLVLLAAFGLLFPRPPTNALVARATIAGLAVGGSATLLAYTLRHDWFWTLRASASGVAIDIEPGGNLVNIAFVGVTAFLVAKLTRDILRERSASHRRQSALVLGGMTLAYAPYATTVLVQVLVTDPRAAFVTARFDRIAAYWFFATFCLSIAVSAFLLVQRAQESERQQDVRFILICYAGVVGLSLAALLWSTLAHGYLLRALGLLAYPLLLGYAIARYEVFDIDRKMRRAATVTLAAAALTVAFIVAENSLESVLEDSVFANVPSAWLSGSAAALITAAIFIPVARASRRAAAKLVPELDEDELRTRKLEIYRHSLAGALADGILKEGESRTLMALRSSLGISDEEHTRLVAEHAV